MTQAQKFNFKTVYKGSEEYQNLLALHPNAKEKEDHATPPETQPTVSDAAVESPTSNLGGMLTINIDGTVVDDHCNFSGLTINPDVSLPSGAINLLSNANPYAFLQPIACKTETIGRVTLSVDTGDEVFTMAPTCIMGRYNHVHIETLGGKHRICSQEFLESLELSTLVIPENTELHYTPAEGREGYYTLSLDPAGQAGPDLSVGDF